MVDGSEAMVTTELSSREPGDVFGRVVFTAEEIFEHDGRQKVVRAGRDEIRSVALCRGSGSLRPLLQVALGLGLAVVGVWVGLGVLAWWREGGRLALDGAFFLTLLLPVGAWVVFDAIRPRLLLRVSLTRGHRKLHFGAGMTDQDRVFLRERLRAACAKHGYPCDISP